MLRRRRVMRVPPRGGSIWRAVAMPALGGAAERRASACTDGRPDRRRQHQRGFPDGRPALSRTRTGHSGCCSLACSVLSWLCCFGNARGLGEGSTVQCVAASGYRRRRCTATTLGIKAGMRHGSPGLAKWCAVYSPAGGGRAGGRAPGMPQLATGTLLAIGGPVLSGGGIRRKSIAGSPSCSAT